MILKAERVPVLLQFRSSWIVEQSRFREEGEDGSNHRSESFEICNGINLLIRAEILLIRRNMDRVREKAVVSHRAIEIRELLVHPFVLSYRGSSQQSKWRLLRKWKSKTFTFNFIFMNPLKRPNSRSCGTFFVT